MKARLLSILISVFILCSTIASVQAQDGTEQWTVQIVPQGPLGVGAVEASPAIGADGTIYVGSFSMQFYAFAQDGTEKWSVPIEAVSSSPAIGADGTIYVGAGAFTEEFSDFNLYAFEPNGQEKWVFWTEDPVMSSPAIGADGTIYVGTLGGILFAINPDGMYKWDFVTLAGDMIISSPAIGADGTIYVGSGSVLTETPDVRLYAIYPDGTEKWSFWTEGPVMSSPAIGADGTIYVVSSEVYMGLYYGNLYAIKPDGTKKWDFALGWNGGDDYEMSSPVIGADGTIYVGGANARCLFAINPDGTYKWHFETLEAVTGSPAIGADGTIYVGVGYIGVGPEDFRPDGALYAITPNGTQKWPWAYGMEGPVVSSPAIGADGTIYVGCVGRSTTGGGGQLIAINGSSEGLADSPWPMFRHDLRHTGRASRCFIATAAFGTELEPRIDTLRSFRDQYLMNNSVGKAFVNAYYKYSPPVANYIAERAWLKTLVRILLLPIIGLAALFV